MKFRAKLCDFICIYVEAYCCLCTINLNSDFLLHVFSSHKSEVTLEHMVVAVVVMAVMLSLMVLLVMFCKRRKCWLQKRTRTHSQTR